MKVENKTHAIILLIILIAIGGVVMYGDKKMKTTSIQDFTIQPREYETRR